MVETVGAEDGDGVIDDRLERGEPVRDPAGRPGEIDDESFLTRAGEAAGQRGARERVDRQHANALGDAGRFALEHGARRLGGDVARRETSAAGGQDQVGDVAVAPCGERRDDLGRVVGDELAIGDGVASRP